MKLSHIIKRLLLGSLCLAIFTQTALAQKHLKVLFGAAPHWIVAYEKVAKQFETDNPDVKTELTKSARAIDDEIDGNDGFPPFGGN